MNREKLQEIVNTVKSRIDLAKAIGIKYDNGRSYAKVNKIISENNLDISHFDANGSWKNIKHKVIQKICPVCGEEFDAKIYPKGNDVKRFGKVTCSKSCSNTYFRSFSNDEYLEKHGGSVRAYRSFCFQYWEKRCALCNWKHTLEVHHIDRNRQNNPKENLIPLCQNHHKLTTLAKTNPLRIEIDRQIDEVIKDKIWSRILINRDVAQSS